MIWDFADSTAAVGRRRGDGRVELLLRDFVLGEEPAQPLDVAAVLVAFASLRAVAPARSTSRARADVDAVLGFGDAGLDC